MTGVKVGEEPLKDSTRQRDNPGVCRRARAAVKTPLVVTGGFRSAKGMAQAITLGGGGHRWAWRALWPWSPICPASVGGQKALAPGQTHHHRHQDNEQMGILEISWYTGQLKRIGRGQPTRPNGSRACRVFPNRPGPWQGRAKKKRVPTRSSH